MEFENQKIRLPAVADAFYPEDPKELKLTIQNFFQNVKLPKIEGDILGLIVPHAGYYFSGQTAAFAFKAISQKEVETVVLIGDSHYEYFDGVSVWAKGEWLTPFGRIKVDEKLAQKLISKSSRFFEKDSAHFFEHSLEVQLPFLQTVLKDFKILPIIIGSQNEDWLELAKNLLLITENKNILFLASSDLSHYPSQEDANFYDKKTIEAILKVDPEILDRELRKLEKLNVENCQTFLCAEDAVKTVLTIMKEKKAKGLLLNYSNSGDKSQDKSKVVGYGAIIFYK